MSHLTGLTRGSTRPRAGTRAPLLALALLLCACAWGDSINLFRDPVWDAGMSWYRWDYTIEVTTSHVGNNQGITFSIYGLKDVLAAGVVTTENPARWTASWSPTHVTWTWNVNAALVPNLYPRNDPGNTTYFWYASSVNTRIWVPWERRLPDGRLFLDGTTEGAGEGGDPEDYAYVTVWDNHISFGALTPTAGSYDSPAITVAAGTPASAWGPTGLVPNSNGWDIAGLRLETTRRLDVAIDTGGHLKRVAGDGGPFEGRDSRKGASTPFYETFYELATQWKVKFFGNYLDAGENPYASPTSGTFTDYNTWTGWSQSGDDLEGDSGWLWTCYNDAWTGDPVGPGYPSLRAFDLIVERNQYEGGTGEPAELWIAERVLQRGLQDVQGNYRQDFQIHITARE